MSTSTILRIATNHVDTDFWAIGSEVYRAPLGIGLDTYGCPMGKRWECSVEHWQRYRAVYSWAEDVAK